MKSAKGEYFFFSLSGTREEIKFSLFSHSPRCLQSSRQILLLFMTFDLLLLLLLLLFYWINTREQIYKDTDVQKILEIFYLD